MKDDNLSEFTNILQEIFDSIGLSAVQQEKLSQDILKAAYLKATNRLIEKLSSENREKLIAAKPSSFKEMQEFLLKNFTREEAKNALKIAIEEVLERFLDRI